MWGCLRLSCLPGLCSIDLSSFYHDLYPDFAIKLALLLLLLGICSTTREDVPDQFTYHLLFKRFRKLDPKISALSDYNCGLSAGVLSSIPQSVEGGISMSPMMIDRVMIPGCHLHTTKHAKKLGKAWSSRTVLVTQTNRKNRRFTYAVDVMDSWHFSGEEKKAFN
jgi:hypothetical protein